MRTLTQIEPRVPISSAPYNITNPGSYYLTTNLTGVSGGSGITVNSGNVTIDLNGFTLQGVAGAGSGIFVSISLTNLVVRNGTVTGWPSQGIDARSVGPQRNLVFELLTVSGNGNIGIYADAGSVVRDCLAYTNHSAGISCAGGEITGCTSKNNGGDGIDIINGSLFHCRSENNLGYGFSLNSARVLDSDCFSNQSAGIYCAGSADEIRRCRIMGNNTAAGILSSSGGNVIEDCEIANNSGYGIYTAGTGGSYIARNNLVANSNGGIVIGDNNNYIEDNHVVTSTGVTGIEVSSFAYTNNVAVKNVVVGGGSAGVNYSNLGNDFGPIDSASTATSPWANISH